MDSRTRRIQSIAKTLDRWFNEPENYVTLGGHSFGVVQGPASLIALATRLADSRLLTDDECQEKQRWAYEQGQEDLRRHSPNGGTSA
jgi:hypothetical protein